VVSRWLIILSRPFFSMKGLLGKYKTLERKEPETRPVDEGREVEERLSKRSRAEKKLVDFLIIGAQKAGTTALGRNLNKHPEIYVKNECQFFTFCWGYGVDWYRQQLQSTRRLIGEKTPEIIYCDDCATRVQEVCPNAKFILCLRDPVARSGVCLLRSWLTPLSPHVTRQGVLELEHGDPDEERDPLIL
jgi:hypothetical protein